MHIAAILLVAGALEAAERPTLASLLLHARNGPSEERGTTRQDFGPGRLKRADGSKRTLVHAAADEALRKKGDPPPPPPTPHPTPWPTPAPTPPPAPAGCTIGDGSSPYEKQMANQPSMLDCVTYVKVNEPEANGATWGFNNMRCYAEFGQSTAHNHNNEYMNCPLTPVPPGCQRGDGHGGVEKQLTSTDSAAECRDFVTENQPSANGATWHVSSKQCYAEFGQTGASLMATGNGSIVEIGPTRQESAAQPLLRARSLVHASVDMERLDKVLMQKGDKAVQAPSPTPKPTPYPTPVPQPVPAHTPGDGSINCPISAMPAGCQNGDGTGGTEKLIADNIPNLKACVEHVSINQPSANGASWGVLSSRCYAEFGQTGTTGGSGADYVNCAVTPAIGVNTGCQSGDGNGGMEIHLSSAFPTMESCNIEVGKRHPSANGATWAPASGDCWAEFGQSGVSPTSSRSYMNCAVTPLAPPGCSEGNGNGAEEHVTETPTMQECIDYVSLHEPSANGASWNPEHPNECFAEMGQSEATGTGWVNCPIEPIAPMGCSEGEGTGGEKVELLKTPSMHACVDIVMQKQPAANGATWSTESQMCIAEFGQAGSSGSGWVNCPVEPTCGPGDGIGAFEEFAGKQETVYACTTYVAENFPSANAMTWGPENQNCYAEFAQNGTDGKDKWLNCPLVPTAALPTPAPTPNVTCAAVEGDGGGLGSSEQYVGRTESMQECAVAVAVHMSAANAATWGPSNKKCYAEFSQSMVVNSTGWQNCYVSAPAIVTTTPTPCVDVSQRRDLVYMSKMDILHANEQLAAEATQVKSRMQALHNQVGELEATRARLKVKFNTTDAYCELRKAQLNAHDRWVQAEMDGLKAECDRAEGLSSSDFEGLLNKVLEAVKRKLE